MFLGRRLESWLSAGIITADQRDQILQIEKEHRVKYVYRSFLALGIVAIAIGVGSLIAFNWEKITPVAKLGIGFILIFILSACAFAMDFSQKLRDYKGILILLFSLLALGMIGLISQVYNRQGDSYEAIFFWSAIVGPLVCFFGNRPAIHIFVALLSSAFLLWIDTKPAADGAFFTYFFLWATPTLLLIALICSFNPALTLLRNAASVWAGIYFVMGTIFVSVIHARPVHNQVFETLFVFAPAVAVIPIWLSRLSLRPRIYLTVSVLIYGFFLAPASFEFLGQLSSAVIFLGLWALIALFFSSIESPRLFDFFLAGVGIRFLFIYFQVFGDLASTGLGLILSGLLIIGFAFLFVKFRERLGSWLRGAS